MPTISTSTIEDIKAWLEQWDRHQDDSCGCETCRRKRAMFVAVEALDSGRDFYGIQTQKSRDTLATIREMLGIE